MAKSSAIIGATNYAAAALTLCLGLPACTSRAAEQPSPHTGQSEGAFALTKTQEQKLAVDAFGDALPQGARTRLGSLRFRPGDGTLRLALSPDGKILATGGSGQTIRLLDATSGKELRRLGSFPREPLSLAFSSDGKTMVVAAYGSALHFWDTATAKELRRLETRQTWLCAVAYSPDGAIVASGGHENTIQLWDAKTGAELRTWDGPTGGARQLTFSPDGRTLASVSATRIAQLWEVTTGKESVRLKPNDRLLSAVAFAPDGKTLASANDAHSTSLWDLTTGRERQRLGSPLDYVYSVAFSPDGKLLAAGIGDWKESAILLWDAATGKLQRRIEANCSVWALVFSADSRILYADAGGNTVRLFETASGKELALRAAHKSWVLAAAFSPDGKIVATGSKDQTIRLWDSASGKALGEIGPHRGGIARIAFSPDGKVLVSVGGDTTIRIWDVANGREIKRCEGHKDLVLSVAFSPDGKTMASSDANGVVRLWEASTGNPTTSFPALGGDLHFVAFLPDKTLVTAFGDRRDTFPIARHDAPLSTVRLWDVAARKVRRTWEWPGEQVFSVAPARDGKTLATGGAQDRIRRWDTATGSERRSFVLRAGSTTRALAFSLDGRMLASGHDDHQVYLWEIATGQERRRFEGHQSAVYTLAFSPDGKTLASGSHDTTALLWEVFGGGLPQGRGPPNSQELESAWIGLKNVDAGKAFQSMGILASAPVQTVTMLKDRLRPVALAAPDTLKRLIADLDSDRFETRQSAAAELENLDILAKEQMRRTLEGSPSPEARRRLEGLLRKLEETVPSAEVLRSLRAIEVLEHVDTPDVRQLLRELAEGAPDARPTREAKATLERMASRRTIAP